MRIPEQVLCDFCGIAMDRSSQWPTVSYPLSRDQREALAPSELPHALSILGLHAPIDLVPLKVMVECCTGCLDGLLPLVKSVAATRVQEALANRRQAAVLSPREDD